MKILTPKKLAAALEITFFIGCLSNTVNATEFSLGDDWKGSVGLQLQTFLADIDNNVSDESSTRIMSGFDPSKLTIGVIAPEYDGVTVSGTFQLVQSINGAKESGDRTFNRAGGGPFQVRIAELSIAGDFGTFKVGRGWGIFGSSSLKHDTGSLPGVGRGASIDGTGVTAGRIDYGYYFPDFHGGIQYESVNYSGVSFRVGIFEPIDVKDRTGQNSDTDTIRTRAEEPRIEAEVNYKSTGFDAWLSVIDSRTEGDEKQSGFDIGSEIRFGPAAITAAFSDGEGIKCCTPSTDELRQWYIETDITFGKTTYGGSYGENEVSDTNGIALTDGELLVLFIHHKLTPQLILVAEWNNETVSPASGGTDVIDQDTLALGVNWQF